MRILHTSDWHLGQEFHGFAREHEHAAFLSWLTSRLEEHAVDALVVAGDIYDSQNPPISAQAQLYRFIGDLRRRLPALDVVLIGGNHDSAGRLEAPGPLLAEFGVRVIGSLPRASDGAIDLDRLLVPLTDASGQVRALCAAVPFLRLPDLPPAPEGEEALVWGVGEIYREAIAAAAARLQPGQALIATGHCYMIGGELSELSERRILGGNQHALPVELFGPDVAYGALGHLHKAQMVGGRPNVRYCGSPLPLSVAERDYRHQVLLVELDGADATVTPLEVPRPVPVLRVPSRGVAGPDAVLAALRALDAPADVPRPWQPYLDVVVRVDSPAPGLRREVEEALAGKGVRLARLKVESSGVEAAEAAVLPDLEDLHPKQVFAQVWSRAHGGEPGAQYLAAFRELLEGLHSAEAAQ